VCSCGVLITAAPALPIFRSLDHQRKKSIYKPVLYGRAILQAAMGTLLPVNEAKFTSLLHYKNVPRLVNELKKKKDELEIESIDTDTTRLLLRKINKGCFYKYAGFLANQLDPKFQPVLIPPPHIDTILVRYRAMARIFATKKEIFNRKWNTKRKSLPYVPVMLQVICENLGFHNYCRDLPKMKSPKRHAKIKRMAQYLYEQSNFLLSRYQER
jgi:hypothetical protein